MTKEINIKIVSVNNVIICEPVKVDRKIEANVNKGFGSIQQKSTLTAMHTRFEFQHETMGFIPAGTVIYVYSEDLHNGVIAKSTYTQKELGEFVVVPFERVIIIAHTEEEKNA